MRKVFSSWDASKAVLVRDALLQLGIEATLDSPNAADHTATGRGAPAVLISNDEDLERATAAVEEFKSKLKVDPDGKVWHCTKCNEENPEAFEVCWKCENAKRSRD